MIVESLRVLLFGMIGVFFVMGVIMFALFLLNKFSKNKEKGADT